MFLIIRVFVRSWRATLIPTMAAPIAPPETFGTLAGPDMSINTLTMFALPLAIVVVDDVERMMEEKALGPV